MKESLQEYMFNTYGKILDDRVSFNRVPDGWFDIIDQALNKLYKIEGIKVLECKEKFAQLRIYINVWDNSEANKILEEAEFKSQYVCEICGVSGERRKKLSGYWIKTLCSHHARIYGYKDEF